MPKQDELAVEARPLMASLTVLIHDFEVSARDRSGAAPPREGLAQEGPAPIAGKPPLAALAANV